MARKRKAAPTTSPATPWGFTYTGFNGHPVVSDVPPRITHSNRRITEDDFTLAAMKATARRLKDRGVPVRESTVMDYNWLPAWANFLRDYRQGWLPPIGTPQDRRAGTNWPFYRTEAELMLLRSGSRILAGINQHAGGMVGGLSAYIVDTGMVCKATPRDGTIKTRMNAAGTMVEDPDAKLCRMTQEVIDEFVEREAFDEKQIGLFQASLVDDGASCRLFNQHGFAHYRTIYAEQIKQPPGTDWREWSFGIKTPADDTQLHQSGWVVDCDNTLAGEEVPFGNFDHNTHDALFYIPGFAPNPRLVDGLKRGFPLFTFGTKESFNSAEKLINNMGMGAAIRQAFAFVREHAAASEGQIQSFVEDQADYETPKVFDPDTNRQTQYFEAGHVEDIPASMKFVNGPANPETQYAVVVADYLYRAAGALWHVPEWLLSGNQSNIAAYTGALVAGNPFVRVCRQAQAYYRRRFLQILETVRRFAVLAGRLPPESLQRVKLTMTLPAIEEQNKLEKAQIDQIEVGMGTKSRQEVVEERGGDWQRVLEDNKEFVAEVGGIGGDQGESGDRGTDAPQNNDGGGGGDDGDSGDSRPGSVQKIPMPGATRGEPSDDDLDPFGDVAESVAAALEKRGMRLVESGAKVPVVEAGFTGVKTYSNGAKHYYRDGVHVKNPSPEEKAHIEKGEAHRQHDSTSGNVVDQKTVDAASDAREANEDDERFVYHYTIKSNLPGIAEGGLGGKTGSVYASRIASPKMADYLYENMSEDENPVLLRMSSLGNWRQDSEYESDKWVVQNRVIPVSEVEIKTVFGWRPLSRQINDGDNVRESVENKNKTVPASPVPPRRTSIRLHKGKRGIEGIEIGESEEPVKVVVPVVPATPVTEPVKPE